MIVHCYPFVSRKSNRTSAIFADRKQITDSCGMEQWVAQRRLGLSDSTPEVNKTAAADKERITLAELSSLYRREEEEERRKEEELRIRKKINRLSCKYFFNLHRLLNLISVSLGTGTTFSILAQCSFKVSRGTLLGHKGEMINVLNVPRRSVPSSP
jgi:hypothetical protein